MVSSHRLLLLLSHLILLPQWAFTQEPSIRQDANPIDLGPQTIWPCFKGIGTERAECGRTPNFGVSFIDGGRQKLYYTGQVGKMFAIFACDLSSTHSYAYAVSSAYLDRPGADDKCVYMLSEGPEPGFAQVGSVSLKTSRSGLLGYWYCPVDDYCIARGDLVAVVSSAGPIESALWLKDSKGSWRLAADRVFRPFFNSPVLFGDSPVVYWVSIRGSDDCYRYAAMSLNRDTMTSSVLVEVPTGEPELFEPVLSEAGRIIGIAGRAVVAVQSDAQREQIYKSERYLGHLCVSGKWAAVYESESEPPESGHGDVLLIDLDTKTVVARHPTRR